MYKYKEIKPQVFLEENQKNFLKVRDNIKALLPDMFTMEQAIRGIYGDSWLAMAYVDRLVELGEIYELELKNYTAGQNRLFKKY